MLSGNIGKSNRKPNGISLVGEVDLLSVG